MTNTDQASDTWIYDHLHKVYFHPLSNNYAVPHPKTGQWSYIPAGEFHAASTSTSISNIASTAQDVINNVNGDEEKEEGEIEDDMGWGGLMDPDKLAEIEFNEKSKSTSRLKPAPYTSISYQAMPNESSSTKEKHPAYVVPYDDPTLYSFPAGEEDPDPPIPSPQEKPNHILRLVVTKSECLEIGQVALVDTRENGIHLGRDRCEKGGQARIRLKEMPVSKTHSVIYWGKGGLSDNDGDGGDVEEEERWWIVDLGSTHGTFITSPPPTSRAHSAETKKPKWTRLSEPKHSSKPFSLQHQSQIKIGSTIFSIHIHPSWPCDLCQINGANEIPLDHGETKVIITDTTEEIPSDNGETMNGNGISQMYAMDSSQKRQNRELKRKREMALLKESLMNKNQLPISTDEEGNPNNGSSNTKREYLDRSAMRRKLHPPSPPKSRLTTPDRMIDSGRSTPPLASGTANNEASGPSKFASSILTNQGWTPGQGLGKSNQGRSEPILTEMRNAKKGLGAKDSKASMYSGDTDKDWKVRGKLRRWDELSKNT